MPTAASSMITCREAWSLTCWPRAFPTRCFRHSGCTKTPHITPPHHTLVASLHPFIDGEARHADERLCREGAEDRIRIGPGHAGPNRLKRKRQLFLVAGTEGFRAGSQRLQP